MTSLRRDFFKTGLGSAASLVVGVVAGRSLADESTAANEPACLDYGQSFICNTAPFNSVRFWIESRTTLTDKSTGESTTFYQCGSCKSENTFGEKST